MTRAGTLLPGRRPRSGGRGRAADFQTRGRRSRLPAAPCDNDCAPAKSTLQVTREPEAAAQPWLGVGASAARRAGSCWMQGALGGIARELRPHFKAERTEVRHCCRGATLGQRASRGWRAPVKGPLVPARSHCAPGWTSEMKRRPPAAFFFFA